VGDVNEENEFSPQMPVMTNVLVVDSDVGFAFWFGYGLIQAGYAAFPAESVPGAKELLDELEIAVVDLLIINTALPEAAGLVEWLRKRNRTMKVVALIDDQPEQNLIPELDVRFQKPLGTDESTRQDLIVQIKKILPPLAIH
jgi:DNA-binding response OmpR family regulator